MDQFVQINRADNETVAGLKALESQARGMFDDIDTLRNARLSPDLRRLPPGMSPDAMPPLVRRQYDDLIKARARHIRDLQEFDFERVQMKLVTHPSEFQEILARPGFAELGRETRGGAAGLMDHRWKFEVRDWALSKKYKGTNRPSFFWDMRFPNAPQMFKERIPINLPSKFPEDVIIDIRALDKPGRFKQMLGAVPPWMNPLDYMATLRGVGGMPQMMRASNLFHEARVKDLQKFVELEKKIGLVPGTEQAHKLGRFADGRPLPTDVITGAEQTYVDHLRTYMRDKIAFDTYVDPATGLRRTNLFEDHIHEGDHLYRIRLDKQQEVFPRIGLQDKAGNKLDVLTEFKEEARQSVFAPPLQPRTAVGGATQTDITQVARAYSQALRKKQFFEPAIKEIAPTLNRLNQSGSSQLYQNAVSMVNHFLGGYGDFDGAFDDLFRAVTGRESKHLATKLSVMMTGMTYRGLLGLNPRTAGLQGIQGIMNNAIQYGFGDTLKGLVRQVTRTDKPVLSAIRESKVLNEAFQIMDKDFVSYLGKSKGQKFMDWMDEHVFFSMLNSADNFNRGWSFHIGHNMAKAAGFSDETAIMQGIKAANETQFLYSKLGASPMRSNPLGRLMLQFQSFAAKQAVFLAQNFQRQPGTMALRYLAVSGMITRSVGNVIDLDRELVPTTPGDVRNLLQGDRFPAIQALRAVVEMGTAMTEEAAGIPIGKLVIDPEFAKEQFGRAVWGTLVPGGAVASRIAKYGPTLADTTEDESNPLNYLASLPARVLGFTEGEEMVAGLRTGGVRKEKDKHGRPIRDLTPDEAAMATIGFRSKQSQIDRATAREIMFQDAWVKRRYERLMTEAVRAVENGRDPSAFLIRASTIAQKQRAVVLQSLRTRLRNQRLSLKERALKRASRPVKQRFQ